ncbi:phosphotransferase [Nocardia rhizosphaerihabitans]|uniref:Aminoglycoside phosphotransferase domain-containing protein n=1 Tax=Nocardia rhizosphaerihabitans TaxID=1691570 RepID=A0ABQ2L5A7_9NOCA|nr:phosphotransferase [Nocardia rhizosphaerihabitans]GGO01451.1 hypothetical protein GCM10011610_71260 [Nocardia rhizosphaerihabitans]
MANDARTAQRIIWRDLPEPARRAVEARLGARVRSALTQPGGFSHGLAARLFLDNDQVMFAKALNIDDPLITMYRTEATTAARLPPQVPAPKLLATIETDGWLITIFENISGSHPRIEDPVELAAMLDAVEQMSQALSPTPLLDVPSIDDLYGAKLTGWRHFAEHGPPADLNEWSRHNLDRLADLEITWAAAAAGDTLLHTDLRPDNMRLRPEGAVAIVDWAWPCTGAAWVDLVMFAPAIVAKGIDPDPILATHTVTRDTDPTSINALLCGLTGYWANACRQPPPPRAPQLREHRARAELVTTHWLRHRLSWP